MSASNFFDSEKGEKLNKDYECNLYFDTHVKPILDAFGVSDDRFAELIHNYIANNNEKLPTAEEFLQILFDELASEQGIEKESEAYNASQDLVKSILSYNPPTGFKDKGGFFTELAIADYAKGTGMLDKTNSSYATFDVTNMKNANEALGRDVVDKAMPVMIGITGELINAIGGKASYGKTGGDELGIVISGLEDSPENQTKLWQFFEEQTQGNHHLERRDNEPIEQTILRMSSEIWFKKAPEVLGIKHGKYEEHSASLFAAFAAVVELGNSQNPGEVLEQGDKAIDARKAIGGSARFLAEKWNNNNPIPVQQPEEFSPEKRENFAEKIDNENKRLEEAGIIPEKHGEQLPLVENIKNALNTAPIDAEYTETIGNATKEHLANLGATEQQQEAMAKVMQDLYSPKGRITELGTKREARTHFAQIANHLQQPQNDGQDAFAARVELAALSLFNKFFGYEGGNMAIDAFGKFVSENLKEQMPEGTHMQLFSEGNGEKFILTTVGVEFEKMAEMLQNTAQQMAESFNNLSIEEYIALTKGEQLSVNDFAKGTRALEFSPSDEIQKEADKIREKIAKTFEEHGLNPQDIQTLGDIPNLRNHSLCGVRMSHSCTEFDKVTNIENAFKQVMEGIARVDDLVEAISKNQNDIPSNEIANDNTHGKYCGSDGNDTLIVNDGKGLSQEKIAERSHARSL